MEISVVQIPRELAWKLRSQLAAKAAAAHDSNPLRPSVSLCSSLESDASSKKNLTISVDGSLNLRVLCTNLQCDVMPSQHSPDKEPLSLQIPRTLMGRLRRRARELGTTLPSYVIGVLSERTAQVVLTSKDYEAIAEATRKAEKTGKRCATRFDGAA